MSKTPPPPPISCCIRSWPSSRFGSPPSPPGPASPAAWSRGLPPSGPLPIHPTHLLGRRRAALATVRAGCRLGPPDSAIRGLPGLRTQRRGLTAISAPRISRPARVSAPSTNRAPAFPLRRNPHTADRSPIHNNLLCFSRMFHPPSPRPTYPPFTTNHHRSVV